MSATTISFGSIHRTGLLAQARRGNRDAFGELVLPYAPGLYRRALRITGNAADAEDVRQEAMLKAMSRLEQFTGSQAEERDDLHAWVGRIAANASIDLIRQRRDTKLTSLEEPSGAGEETLAGTIAARSDNPEERFARRQMRQLFAQAIKQLPSDLRQVCLLRDVLQYSTQEVAERLGVSTVAVRLRLFRAHRRLREQLEHALQPRKQQGIRRNACVYPAKRTGPAERKGFLGLGQAAGFACGD
jgi:RNA polymerase sigma-70 factor (ECF subfamily)